MNISIFGLGYVGCVSVGCLAQFGHKVIGVDVNPSKVDLINTGNPTIIEKDIDVIIHEQFQNGRISATQDFRKAVLESSVSIICVGTPSTPQGHLNLDYIFKTAGEIGEALKLKRDFHVVVIRSTVLPGTNHKVGEIIESASGKKRNEGFAVVSNPEFLREGSAVKDYFHPPVTVIGSDNENTIGIMKEMYKELEAPLVVKDIKVAELIKYVNNAFHALKVTFANEVGNICKKIGIDSHDVMDLFCMDTQLNLSPYYLKSGFAYGGSCLPKDLKALKTLAHDTYLTSPVLNSIEESNQNQIKLAIEMIISKEKRKIGILGLSFKMGTDDLRYSPIVVVAEYLFGKGYEIHIFDENVNLSKITGTNKEYIDKHIPHLSDLIQPDLETVIEKSEVLVITQKDKRFNDIASRYSDKIVIDLARIDIDHQTSNYEGICW
jgi:GDP-mannose 6-dehydrogenase